MSKTLDDLFIFEMANNHQGSVEHGIKIIKAMGAIARKYKIKASVKFQFRDLPTFIHPDAKGRTDIKHIPRFESTEMSKTQFRDMINVVKEEGMLVVATPFDEVSVGTCLDLGVQVIKVASCSSGDWPLLEAIAKARKPVIMSTGGLDIYAIDNAVSFLRKRVPELAVLHCVGMYPTPFDHLHMNFMSKMIRRYPYISIGYSGHEDPDATEVATVAISKGAKILERHVGVPTDDIKLNGYSMNPEQTERWIEAALRAKEICGNVDHKHVSQSEIDSLLSLQRGVFAKGPIKKGDEITPDKIFFAMPPQEGQLTSGPFGRNHTHYVASKDYALNEAVFERSQDDEMNQLRGILHDAKGQVFEAGIELGDDYTIEISHHKGLESFRQFGCIMANIVNREYCKKIIIQLPGQKNPLHHHKKKEETFHLLWGDMEVELNGNIHHLKAGDKLLIERGAVHGFTTTHGCIFEEVSTQHFVRDSYYEDQEVAELDPMQRKTVLESW